MITVTNLEKTYGGDDATCNLTQKRERGQTVQSQEGLVAIGRSEELRCCEPSGKAEYQP